MLIIKHVATMLIFDVESDILKVNVMRKSAKNERRIQFTKCSIYTYRQFLIVLGCRLKHLKERMRCRYRTQLPSYAGLMSALSVRPRVTKSTVFPFDEFGFKRM